VAHYGIKTRHLAALAFKSPNGFLDPRRGVQDVANAVLGQFHQNQMGRHD
jgi:hypothetical protein